MEELGNLEDYIPYRLYFTLRRILKNKEFTKKINKNNPNSRTKGKQDMLDFKVALKESKNSKELDKAVYVSKIISPYNFFKKHAEFEDIISYLIYTKDWEKEYINEKCPLWSKKLVKTNENDINPNKLKNLEFM
ncbi:hypothetical protein [Methanobrevibacter filiformis]|uniref:Uncharacterized protein n=1 Tax=Methanobrevibacter filiformis TaxID=55758 RepID=A0A166BKQ1_9EURY|nr:hypothetical protein [Methanobrevibacter filiformis]KZX13496.1 hypothetical protein MBFIL_10180 [Methanobrevibacter filiformis]